MKLIEGTSYEVDETQLAAAGEIAGQVANMRQIGALTPDVLGRIRKYFRIKNIYNSNAIEGNILDVGETRLVVEQGLTLTGKPLKDQAEARNLSAALDFLEDLASDPQRPITEADIRQIHLLVLKGINDVEAGKYRTANVEISGSQFKPTAPESISAEMAAFGAWMQRASVPGDAYPQNEAIAVASAAHTWFVTIHPFIDGNGRVGRLLMNLMLMRYGFPIAIISRDDRLRYYDSLEISQACDLTPFVSLICECLEESLEEYQAAAEEQRASMEWARSIASKFGAKEKIKASNNYEVWKNAMELLKSVFRNTTEVLDENSEFARIYFADFGTIEFEKYASLKNQVSAKKTWFFRIDFRSGSSSARYLFFFGSPSHAMRPQSDVTLFVSREEPSGSFKYERLRNLTSPNVPTIYEIGYEASREVFIVRGSRAQIRTERADQLCKRFIQDVIEKHFSS